MNQPLPEIFRNILWSYKFEDMDIAKHKKTIILQAINYGSLAHWRWINQTYGQKEVQQVLRTVPISSFRHKVIKLVSLLFNIPEQQFNHALRGTHR